MFVGTTLASKEIVSTLSWGYWAKNQWVCRSGVTTAEVCGLKMMESRDVRSKQSGIVFKGLIIARQKDGRTAALPGDSGGPVYSYDGTGLMMRGVVSGTVDGRPQDLTFQDMADVRNRLVGTSMRVVTRSSY